MTGGTGSVNPRDASTGPVPGPILARQSMAELPPIIGSLEDIAPRYQVILCDVWGVVHNGERAFPAASSALAMARQHGLAVVLITNAPRPNPDVIAQLATLGVP